MSAGGQDAGTDAGEIAERARVGPVRGDLAVLEAAFAGLAEGVTVHDATGKVVLCNPAASKIFGLSADELLGASARRPVLEVGFQDGTPMTPANSLVGRVVASRQVERGVVVQFPHPRTGARCWLEGTLAPLCRDGDEEPWGVVSSWVDISSRREVESTLRELGRQARVALASSSTHIFVKDRDGRYVFVNEPLARWLGLPPAEVLGKRDADILSPELAEVCAESHRRALEQRTVVETEETWPGADGPQTYLTLKVPLLDEADRPQALIGLMTDITERARAEAALREREESLTALAFHDPLTGLANRWLLEERMSAALTRAREANTAVGVLLLDVNNLKQVNDAHGHPAGDAFLREIARRIEQAVDDHFAAGDDRGQDRMVVRQGGDEFVVVVPDIEDAPEAFLDRCRARIESGLRAPFEVAGRRLEATVSIGTALFPHHGEDCESLLGHADAAMYRMKRTARRAG